VTSGRVTVVSAHQPTIRILPTVARGAALSIQLSGFPADSDVRIAVYGQRTPLPSDQNYDFVAELPPARTDAHGDAYVEPTLPTEAGPGSYLLSTDPGTSTSDCIESSCTRFQVTVP
jgi:hypothetical protein